MFLSNIEFKLFTNLLVTILKLFVVPYSKCQNSYLFVLMVYMILWPRRWVKYARADGCYIKEMKKDLKTGFNNPGLFRFATVRFTKYFEHYPFPKPKMMLSFYASPVK